MHPLLRSPAGQLALPAPLPLLQSPAHAPLFPLPPLRRQWLPPRAGWRPNPPPLSCAARPLLAWVRSVLSLGLLPPCLVLPQVVETALLLLPPCLVLQQVVETALLLLPLSCRAGPAMPQALRRTALLWLRLRLLPAAEQAVLHFAYHWQQTTVRSLWLTAAESPLLPSVRPPAAALLPRWLQAALLPPPWPAALLPLLLLLLLLQALALLRAQKLWMLMLQRD